jgi:hypothetical protein
MEHLANCHGELNLLWLLIGSVPFVGAWLHSFKSDDSNDTR